MIIEKNDCFKSKFKKLIQKIYTPKKNAYVPDMKFLLEKLKTKIYYVKEKI